MATLSDYYHELEAVVDAIDNDALLAKDERYQRVKERFSQFIQAGLEIETIAMIWQPVKLYNKGNEVIELGGAIFSDECDNEGIISLSCQALVVLAKQYQDLLAKMAKGEYQYKGRLAPRKEDIELTKQTISQCQQAIEKYTSAMVIDDNDSTQASSDNSTQAQDAIKIPSSHDILAMCQYIEEQLQREQESLAPAVQRFFDSTEESKALMTHFRDFQSTLNHLIKNATATKANILALMNKLSPSHEHRSRLQATVAQLNETIAKYSCFDAIDSDKQPSREDVELSLELFLKEKLPLKELKLKDNHQRQTGELTTRYSEQLLIIKHLQKAIAAYIEDREAALNTLKCLKILYSKKPNPSFISECYRYIGSFVNYWQEDANDDKISVMLTSLEPKKGQAAEISLAQHIDDCIRFNEAVIDHSQRARNHLVEMGEKLGKLKLDAELNRQSSEVVENMQQAMVVKKVLQAFTNNLIVRILTKISPDCAKLVGHCQELINKIDEDKNNVIGGKNLDNISNEMRVLKKGLHSPFCWFLHHKWQGAARALESAHITAPSA